MSDAAPTKESNPATQSARSPLLLGLLILVSCIGFLATDVAAPTLFDSPFPAMIILGIVTAQLTILCVWGTLVHGTFWVRLPWTLLLLVISWCAFAWGISIGDRGGNVDSMLGVGIMWTLGFVASFVPLKLAAICFRWQIVQPSNDPNESKKTGYAIRDIMTGTLLLAIARTVLPDEKISLTQAWYASGLNEPELLVAVFVFGVASLLVKLPCIWISLGSASQKIPAYILLGSAGCLGIAIAEISVLSAIIGPLGDIAELPAGIILSHQLMGGIILAVCLSLRGLGYRLRRSTKA